MDFNIYLKYQNIVKLFKKYFTEKDTFIINRLMKMLYCYQLDFFYVRECNYFILESLLQHCITPELQNGLCVPYKECPLVKEIQQNYTSYDLIPEYYTNLLKESRCSHNNEHKVRFMNSC